MLRDVVGSWFGLTWAAVPLSEPPASLGSTGWSSPASGTGIPSASLRVVKPSQEKPGMVPAKEALGPPARRCPESHRADFEGDPHTHVPGSYYRDRSGGYGLSDPHARPADRSRRSAWALSERKRERHDRHHGGQAAVRAVGKKTLGTAAPRTAAVSKTQGGTAALRTRRITPRPPLGCETTPLQNPRGAAGKKFPTA